MTRIDRLPQGVGGTWEITTSHGTRTYFDFDDALFHRVPNQGRPSRFGHDNKWTRLGLGPRTGRIGEPWTEGVRVGWQMHYGISIREDYYSTDVVSCRQVGDDIAPPPNRPWIRFNDPADLSNWSPMDVVSTYEVLGSWDSDGIRGSGPTREAALLEFANEFDEWLMQRVCNGDDTRTIRRWHARLDEERSVLSWLRAKLEV